MTEQKTSSRRALMKGVAWAAPVAAVAVAAPAYAASNPVTITVDPTLSCKQTPPPGRKDAYYYLTFSMKNNLSVPINYDFTALWVQATSGQPVNFTYPPDGTLAPGATVTWTVCSGVVTNTAQGTAGATVEVSAGTNTFVVTKPLEVASLPPCNNNANTPDYPCPIGAPAPVAPAEESAAAKEPSSEQAPAEDPAATDQTAPATEPAPATESAPVEETSPVSEEPAEADAESNS
ncbi:hypothetical protein [Brachybacterium aquaticum]|uniref:DUF11 domain-containing protein n=1 Tax=Brachybacterium aquaticum TaxID=1432564 RepID=A0A841AFK1_9MICO|nr:hypothetical protein [Brachybacterium aquaticum]MBB5832763.1 hypothetical protein [Brachybacterium aquaticum]